MTLTLPGAPKTKVVTCSHGPCSESVHTEQAHRFSIGITHYSKSKGQSYIQVHDDQHSCSLDHAKLAIHARIESHKDLEHGEFDAEKLNPEQAYADALVQGNAEYHPLTRAWSTLPTYCCVCRQDLTNDVYVPHVDHSSRGTCYQAILQARGDGAGSLEQYDLGACSNEHAVAAAHAIVDEILAPPEE